MLLAGNAGGVGGAGVGIGVGILRSGSGVSSSRANSVKGLKKAQIHYHTSSTHILVTVTLNLANPIPDTITY